MEAVSSYTAQNGPRDTGSVLAARYVLTPKALAYLAALDQQRQDEAGEDA